MQPVSPVIPGLDAFELVIAKDQPEYQPLPALVTDVGQVTTRWEFTQEERDLIAAGGDVFLSMQTYGHSLQPVMLAVARVVQGGDTADNLMVMREMFGDGSVPTTRFYGGNKPVTPF